MILIDAREAGKPMKSVFGISSRDYDDISVYVAALSVLLVFVAAVVGMTGSSWQLRMYMSVALMLFDLFFVIEFSIRLTSSLTLRRQAARVHLGTLVLLGLSSVVPFILVSGPFLIGWAQADFSAVAVRGYWSSPSPVAALGTVAALRLLRPLRLFYAGFSYQNPDGKSPVMPLATSLILIFSFALAVDALVLPGYRSILINQRSRVTQELTMLLPEQAKISAVTMPDVEALVRERVLVYRHEKALTLQPGEYEYFGNAADGVWFSMKNWQRARSGVEMISSLLALWLPLIILARRAGKHRPYHSGTLESDQSDSRRLPVGCAELKGILGK